MITSAFFVQTHARVQSKRRSSGSPVRRVEQLVEEPEYDEVRV